MEVKVNSNFKKALRDIGNVPRKYVPKAMVTALNKVGAEVVTQAKRELKDATGLKAGVVAKKIKTRFPILFKRALEFHLMKAQSRLR